MLKGVMRFFFWFSFVIYWFFLILAPLNVFAKEEWSITKFDKLINAAVSGEVTHGDTLNFFIRSEDNCSKVWNTFSFYTYEKPGDIKQLLNKHVPIKINGKELSAKVITVNPFLMGYRVGFSLGNFPVKEYIYFLKEFYDGFEKYEIEIVDGLDFKASKYFDIRSNNWKLDNLVPKILEASKACKEITQLKL
tara:strand:+ start:292 stop:867 length:576 start_codon:yes stop_codon:yes gene_type:complete